MTVPPGTCGLRGGRDLRRGVAGQQRLVASLMAPRLLRARRGDGADGVVVVVVVELLLEPDPLAALATP